MIYMEPAALGWRPLLTSWLNELPQTLKDSHKELLEELFVFFCVPLLSYVTKIASKVSVIVIFHVHKRWYKNKKI